MKTSLILISILAVLLLFQTVLADSIDEKFQKFKHTHRRTYTGQQNKERKKSFEEHMKSIQNRQREGKKVPVNDLIDKTAQELKALTGLIIEQTNLKREQVPILQSFLASSTPPQEYDYRTLNKVTVPKQQGGCGSCWAFAAVAHYESLLLMNHQGIHDLSEQFVLQCTYPADKNGCLGGWPLYANNLITTNGIPQDIEPYKYESSSTIFSDKQICSGGEQNFVKLDQQITQNTFLSNLQPNDVKRLLITHGPMTVAVMADFDEFYFPEQGGFINSSKCGTSPRIDHAILLVGYKVHEAKEYWIIKNSWGTNWGDNGFGYLPIDMDCGLSNYIFFIQHEGNFDNIQMQTLTIQMTDTYGDGWNYNVLGFMQNNLYKGLFGENFISGYSQQQTVQIPKGFETSIVVKRLASWSNQIGFRILRQDGSVLFNMNPGQSFSAQQVFHVFMSGEQGQQVTTEKTYEAQLRDTYGDGWNGNTLIIKQGQTIVAELGENFNTGTYYGPVYFTVSQGVTYQVTTGLMGSWRAEIILKIRDQTGNLVFTFGQKFYSQDEILGSFTVGSVNLFAQTMTEKEDQGEKKAVKQQDSKQEEQGSAETSATSNYEIAITVTIVCFSAVLIVLIGSMIFLMLKLVKKNKKITGDNSLTSSSTLKIPENVV